MTAAAQCVIYLIAFLLPWWSYIDLPQYLVFPLLAARILLVILFAGHAIRRGLRIPFEFLLPLTILAIMAVCGYAANLIATPLEFHAPLLPLYSLDFLLYPFCALAVIHFATSKNVALIALDVLTISTAAAAAIMALGRFTGLFITPARIGNQDIWTLPNLVIYAIAAAALGAHRRQPGNPLRRPMRAAVIMLLVTLLINYRALDFPRVDLRIIGQWWQPINWFAVWFFGILIALWPAARAAAKIVLVRNESTDKNTATWMLILIALAALAIIRYPVMSTNEFFIIALAAAWAIPDRQPQFYKPGPLFAAVAATLAALIAFNLLNVNPHNFRDPRNYAPEVGIQQFQAMSEYYVPRIQRVEDIHPAETQTNLWLAFAKLSEDDLIGAAVEYRKSLRTTLAPSGKTVKTILPHPNPEQRQAFMDALRDASSAKSPAQHQGAYVFALVGEERFEEAIALMKKDAATAAPPPIDESARHMLAAAIAVYLADARVAQRLADWTAPDLIALLAAWDAKIKAAPPDISPQCLPIIIVTAPKLCDTLPPDTLAAPDIHAACLPTNNAIAISTHDIQHCAQTLPPIELPVTPRIYIYTP